MNTTNDNTCHQFKKKMENKEFDLKYYKLDKNELISIEDLEFEVIRKEHKKRVSEVYKFITRYEWLQSINNYWNYAFALTYKDKLVAVVMIGTPNMFSKLIGENTKNLEQTILRGASCSIAPYNSGSFLISRAINFLIENTPYRIFSGYSTTHEAMEYGYVYQSLNFLCVSKNAGTRLEYLKPGTEKRWLSDRHLRKLSNYKKQSAQINITWDKSWNDKWKILWDNVPDDIEKLIRDQVKKDMKNLTFRRVPPKLKYVLIKGKDKRETKQLLRLFKEHNPKLVNVDGSLGLAYPKKGGKQ